MTREELLLRGWHVVAFILPLACVAWCWSWRRRDVPWPTIWISGVLLAIPIAALFATHYDIGGGGRFVSRYEWRDIQRAWNALTPDERTAIRVWRAAASFVSVLAGLALAHGAGVLIARLRR
jgi:hypothetical protein